MKITKALLILILIGMISAACAAPGSPANPAGSSPAATALVQADPDCPPTVEKAIEATLNMTSEELKAFADRCGDTATTVSVTNWEITWYKGADLDRGDGTTFRDDAEKWTWSELEPAKWPTFPNEPNPLVPEFRVVNKTEVPDGMEFANAESNFCQQLSGEDCHFTVAPLHYMSYSGDYRWGKFVCEQKDGIGCNLIFVQVGKVASDQTAWFGQGYRLHARFFNGDTLPIGIWALASHIDNVMMDMPSELNPDQLANAGGNCSVPEGCDGVDTQVIFMSGNEVLMSMHTVVKK